MTSEWRQQPYNSEPKDRLSSFIHVSHVFSRICYERTCVQFGVAEGRHNMMGHSEVAGSHRSARRAVFEVPSRGAHERLRVSITSLGFQVEILLV